MKKTTRPILLAPAAPLTTTRLFLRPIRQSDLADLHALRTQIEVMKWTSTGEIDADREVTQVWMNRFLPPNDAITFNYAVEELTSPGKVIGVLGCHILDPPELGYMFRKESWGKGYAFEALQRWLQAWWALPRREVVIESEDSTSTSTFASDADSVVSEPEVLRARTDAENAASARLLGKCGFRLIGEGMTDVRGRGILQKTITLELEQPQ
ncbi:hypothetical protein A1O3_07010 [Capronia epimyces CBS 606.96]|uniref:N-acetyltransferase domain-containing protein n=1 Tax=Capronia epimyces CBS 606.96 TaxID=1182542 RepID=W9XUP3_9EURO|nr:uncharacterized protein A1O3_07010 [Capronia epimyces CBS 606.96]EXJ80726.1 hypothetical protein A1O3_07010 [Capronia epimyces CBS 606.96]